MKKFSLILFALHSLVIGVLSAQAFRTGLDKIVLILMFVFVLLSYVMMLLWRIELKEASFRPGFNSRSLYRFIEYPIQVQLISPEATLAGMLSNWDDNSFYIFTEESSAKLGKIVDVKIQLNGHSFLTKAKIVSLGPKGLGLRVIEQSALASRDWKSFYDIIKNRGYINRFA